MGQARERWTTEHRLGLTLCLARLRKGCHRWALAPEFALILPRLGVKTAPLREMIERSRKCDARINPVTRGLSKKKSERIATISGGQDGDARILHETKPARKERCVAIGVGHGSHQFLTETDGTDPLFKFLIN
jgi:hypothetical protein